MSHAIQKESVDSRKRPLDAGVKVFGRALVAALFIFAGLSKILGPQPYLDHMKEFGVPTALLPAVIALEMGAGLTLLLGWRLRVAAGALGVFCILTAVIFHHELGIKTERTHFFKDLAIAGGLLMAAAHAEAIGHAPKSSSTPEVAVEPRARTHSAVPTTIPHSTARVMADDVLLAVHRAGRGSPIVCLSAIGHDCHDYDALTEGLSDEFEVVRIEWPGHGDSGDDHEPASAARYADLLVAALDQLQLDTPILIGNSIGGAASILYASRRPVRGLVLCDSGGLVEITANVRRICRLYERFFAAGERGAVWFAPAFRAYYRMVLTQPAASEQRQRIAAGAQRRARLFREAWASFGTINADIRDAATSLAVPIWVAWAEHDRTIPLKYCLPAIRRFKNVTLSTFDAGHSPFLEQPRAFVDGFLGFVDRLPTTVDEDMACAAI